MSLTQSDEELMTRVAGGSEAAFAEIVDRYHARLLHVFRVLGCEWESAKDLAQECFLRLLRAAPRYEPRAAFSTFLFTIARRLARDERDRAWVRRREPLQEEPAGSADPSEDVERKELRAKIQAVLATLSREDREALVWSEVAGMSNREIARLSGVPEGTVASRKHRAVRQVRERWKGELP